jgi:hypothetical protein
MLETIKEEFLTELANTTTFSGSLFTREDVAKIIGQFAEKAQATITALPQQREICDELIIQISDIAEGYARLYVEECLENYDYEGCVDYDTNEYNGELRVTANVNIESSDFRSSGSFQDDNFMNDLEKLFNPKQEA